jgi:hypothetical protein
MKIHTGIFLFTCLLLANTSLGGELLNGEARGQGEVVVINGKERPDLVDQFDLIKNKTVMIKGTVFVKDINGNPVVPLELENEIQKYKEERESLAKERESNILKTSTSVSCNRCDICGQKVCNTRQCLLCKAQFCPGPPGGPYNGCSCYK